MFVFPPVPPRRRCSEHLTFPHILFYFYHFKRWEGCSLTICSTSQQQIQLRVVNTQPVSSFQFSLALNSKKYETCKLEFCNIVIWFNYRRVWEQVCVLYVWMWSLCRTQECDNCRSGFLNATSISINVVCAHTESYVLFMFIYIYKESNCSVHTHTDKCRCERRGYILGTCTFRYCCCWERVPRLWEVPEECFLFFIWWIPSVCLYNILQEPHQSP